MSAAADPVHAEAQSREGAKKAKAADVAAKETIRMEL